MPSTTALSLAASLLLLGLASCAATAETAPDPAPEEPVTRAASEAAASTDEPQADVTTLVFQVEIAAPVQEVWTTMLDPEGYGKWTSPFGAGSYFEGSWAEGERMRFLGPGGNGMVARIAAHRRHELLSIEHLGFVMNGVEDTSSAAVQRWAPAFETYRFASTPGGTQLTVEHDVLAGYTAFMNEVWPKSLAALKALCEREER